MTDCAEPLKKPTPIVSIIIPVYNDEKHVARAIESALNQTLKEIEVIVVDDGSTDGTPEILKRYEGQIIHVRQENKGVSGARNMGIAHSRGRYVCFLDQDDTLMPNKAELQAALLDVHPEAGLCYGAWHGIDPRDGRVLSVHRVRPDKVNRGCSALPPGFQIGAAMIRREWLDKVGGFCEEFKQADDTDLRFRLWAAGCRFLPVSELVSTWTVRAPGNASSVEMWLEHLEALERHFASMGNAIDERLRNEHRVKTLLRIGTNYLRKGCLCEARAAWAKALVYQPSLFNQLQRWSTVLRFLDPDFPLNEGQGFPDFSLAWDNMLASITETRRGPSSESPVTKSIPRKSLPAYVLSSLAWSKGRFWLARWWLIRSLIHGQGKLPRDTDWHDVVRTIMGPTLTRFARLTVRALRPCKSRRAGQEEH